MASQKVIILCKTYPSPSGRYSETSCLAGIRPDGSLIRLFPVPFRLIGDEQQFKKWQPVEVHCRKAKADHRPESHSVTIDSIRYGEPPLSTRNNWDDRRAALKQTIVFSDFDAMETNRLEAGHTLALLRPKRVASLEITELKEKNWTKEEKEKLVAHQKQAGLFDQQEERNVTLLRKLPYDFHYNYVCDVDGVEKTYRHKIVDWEAGALFWQCKKRYGSNWEAPFRQKLEDELPARDLLFLMGTIHRFPDKWLIVSLIYPPLQKPVVAEPDLFSSLTPPLPG